MFKKKSRNARRDKRMYKLFYGPFVPSYPVCGTFIQQKLYYVMSSFFREMIFKLIEKLTVMCYTFRSSHKKFYGLISNLISFGCVYLVMSLWLTKRLSPMCSRSRVLHQKKVTNRAGISAILN